MNRLWPQRGLAQFLAAAVLGCAAASAGAQSDEPWVVRAPVPPGTRPLLALLLDTSEAMARSETLRAPYDPMRDYGMGLPAPCDPNRLYWRRGPGAPPDCDGGASIALDSTTAQAGFRCEAGRRALARTGIYVASRAAQWEAHGSGGHWRELRAGDDGAVECRADRGRHGESSGVWFAADGPSGPWRGDAGAEPLWDSAPLSDSYVFLSGNYLNYLAHDDDTATTDLYSWVASSIVSAAAAVDEADLALLRLSHDGMPGDDAGRGGMVALAPVPLPDGAALVADALAGWTPSGPAPLAEALVEAASWLAGGPLIFGAAAHAAPDRPLPSVAEVRHPQQSNRYVSPFAHACRPVFLGLIAAAEPAADAGAGQAALNLPAVPAGFPDCGNACLGGLLNWLRRADLVAATPGLQHPALAIATTQPPPPAIREAAWVAGLPLLDLADPLSIVMVVARALQHDAAVAAAVRVSAPTVDPVDAPGGAPVYYGLSSPALAGRWLGNVRRYAWRVPDQPWSAARIVDRRGNAAFDEAGSTIEPESWSQWAERPDGADAALGGAAAALPDPTARVVYTDLVSNRLTEPGNRFTLANPLVTRESLGLTDRDPRGLAALSAWVLGADAFDADGDGDRDEARLDLGDPGLSPSRPVRFGGPTGFTLVFVATNDGVLHAFDAADGVERWAFLPRPFLPLAAALAGDVPTTSRSFGLDGSLTVHLHDADGDGSVTPGSGDRAWLFLGLGRSGSGYYALEVTDPAAPRVLWSLTGSAAALLGEAWPAVVIARMRLDDRRQSAHRLVAILAGGHDPAQAVWPQPADARGARLLILDAESGEVLWEAAGPGDPDADLTLAALAASLPSAPRVLDSDGDGYADRLYLLGIAGQLWRIDFTPGSDPAGLARGRLLASFGDADAPGEVPRRFYAAPDVSYDASGGQARFIIAFGSGWLSRPRDPRSEDRFYAVFDPVAAPADPVATLVDDDLSDVTESPHVAAPGAPGWLLRLVAHGRGEKTVGTSLTFDHDLRFTTYQPLPAPPHQPCGPPAGISRLYTLDVRNGRPVNWIGDAPVPSEDLAVEGLPPAARVVFPRQPARDGCAGPGCAARPFALIAGRSLDLGFDNGPVKTSWRRLDPAAP